MNKWLLLSISLFLCSMQISAQQKASAYVDKEGILRWSKGRQEIVEFGVHYALPFSAAFRDYKALGLDFEKGIEQDVYHLTRLGLKAYRVHMWDAEVTDTLGNLINNEHLRYFDYTVKQMKDRGFKMLLTPLNYYATREVPYGIGQKWGKAGSYSPEAITATKNYLRQLMEHVNPFTGNAYKDDEDIIGYELYNEPEHQGFTVESVVPYINDLVSAIRQAGCKKPLFWCMSIAPHLIEGFVNADIQGGSMQWYSVSHNAGFQFKGNLLTHIDEWPKDTLSAVVRNNRKALVSYELDAADNAYSYTYPLMARSMREVGFQFASMFSYDPMGIAAYNTEYRTHYMNMAYAPKKAMGLKIAGEVFRRIPRMAQFGRFPEDTTFDVFHVNHEADLAEMVSDEKFFYSNTTGSVPPRIDLLRSIAGIGSSCVVKYDGRGIYMLDKLEDGVWRLEVMPDATWIDNPFGLPRIGKEMSAIVWSEYPMTIDLPDLGAGYSVRGINNGNVYCTIAEGKTVSIVPGTFLVERKGVKTHFKPTEKWQDIVLNEYSAPAATTRTYLLHTPVKEISRDSDISYKVEIISQKEPTDVLLEVYSLSPSSFKPIRFDKVSRYGYIAHLTEEMLQEDILKYRIAVVTEDGTEYYPSGEPGEMVDFINTDMLTTRLVESSAPVVLMDISEDYQEIRRNHRHYRYHFVPSEIPGKMGVELQSNSMTYASHYVMDCTNGRREDITSKSTLHIRAASTSGNEVSAWVILQGSDGFEYGTQILLSPRMGEHFVPLSDLKQVRVTGPGEKGFVYVKPFDGEQMPQDLSKLETVKFAVLPQENNQQAKAVFEYIVME